MRRKTLACTPADAPPCATPGEGCCRAALLDVERGASPCGRDPRSSPPSICRRSSRFDRDRSIGPGYRTSRDPGGERPHRLRAPRSAAAAAARGRAPGPTGRAGRPAASKVAGRGSAETRPAKRSFRGPSPAATPRPCGHRPLDHRSSGGCRAGAPQQQRADALRVSDLTALHAGHRIAERQSGPRSGPRRSRAASCPGRDHTRVEVDSPRP